MTSLPEMAGRPRLFAAIVRLAQAVVNAGLADYSQRLQDAEDRRVGAVSATGQAGRKQRARQPKLCASGATILSRCSDQNRSAMIFVVPSRRWSSPCTMRKGSVRTSDRCRS